MNKWYCQYYVTSNKIWPSGYVYKADIKDLILTESVQAIDIFYKNI